MTGTVAPAAHDGTGAHTRMCGAFEAVMEHPGPFPVVLGLHYEAADPYWVGVAFADPGDPAEQEAWHWPRDLLGQALTLPTAEWEDFRFWHEHPDTLVVVRRLSDPEREEFPGGQVRYHLPRTALLQWLSAVCEMVPPGTVPPVPEIDPALFEAAGTAPPARPDRLSGPQHRVIKIDPDTDFYVVWSFGAPDATGTRAQLRAQGVPESKLRTADEAGTSGAAGPGAYGWDSDGLLVAGLGRLPRTRLGAWLAALLQDRVSDALAFFAPESQRASRGTRTRPAAPAGTAQHQQEES